MADRRCLVAVVHNLPMVPAKTAQSLMEIGWGNRVERAKALHGFSEISFWWSVGFPRVDALRDSAAVLALKEGFSHLLFLDADMVWPTDTLERMLRHHEAGIVGGLYCMRHPPYAPVALKDGFVPEGSPVTQYWHDQEATEIGASGLRPVDVLGMGCTLIPTEVFREIGPRPWFMYANDANGWPVVTEDVPFCQRAKASGYGIFLDPTISCGHVTSMVVDVQWHRRFQEAYTRTVETLPIQVRVTSPENLEVPAAAGG